MAAEVLLADDEITALLGQWEGGDASARDLLMERVYTRLHRIASHQLKGERRNHSIQPTALVNEAYLRLVGQTRVHWKARDQFFAIASRMMRRVLVDHARRRSAQRRDPGGMRITIDETLPAPVGGNVLDVIRLERALEKLESMDRRASSVVELRFFGGLSVEETARHLGVDKSTVKRDWSFARAWLIRELTAGGSGQEHVLE